MEWMVPGMCCFASALRVKLRSFLAAQTRCVVAMEACAGARYWAREEQQANGIVFRARGLLMR
jgi:hypothetical protein